MPDNDVIITIAGKTGSGKSVLQSLIEAMLQGNNIKFASDDEKHTLIVDIKPFINHRSINA